MNGDEALTFIGELPVDEIRGLWDVGIPLPGTSLRSGLWYGRNGGMSALMKWLARRVVKRDYFAKLVFEDFGINLRVRQDGTFAPRRTRAGTLKLDLPFALTAAGLDYGVHIGGVEPKGVLQMRDELRAIDFGTLAQYAGQRRVALDDDGHLVLGYIEPLGLSSLAGTPFGMVWRRDVLPEELEAARDWVGKRRLLDSSPVTN